ncbi:hypothetical protein M7I_3048 [Glarea lozoyensis 74030]|uniref:Uncharacterized protein n=1 Tax=Glarea lozoyensis (strain ATCC 74030 / MF5533) TaxID=1104152 RepID=H0EKF0_GLAL7|nr:hypothetical protein M7I_3048 [Glarea lozoyensis 74030]
MADLVRIRVPLALLGMVIHVRFREGYVFAHFAAGQVLRVDESDLRDAEAGAVAAGGVGMSEEHGDHDAVHELAHAEAGGEGVDFEELEGGGAEVDDEDEGIDVLVGEPGGVAEAVVGAWLPVWGDVLGDEFGVEEEFLALRTDVEVYGFAAEDTGYDL